MKKAHFRDHAIPYYKNYCKTALCGIQQHPNDFKSMDHVWNILHNYITEVDKCETCEAIRALEQLQQANF